MTSTQSQIPPQRLKIACFHGFNTNKEFMKKQTIEIAKELADFADLFFIDGPQVIPKEISFDQTVLKYLEAEPRAWFDPRLMYKNHSKEGIKIVLDSIRLTMEAQSDHYDGLIGFSQGSFAMQLLLWLQAAGVIDWKILKGTKFFISFSSYIPKYIREIVKEHRLPIPTIHFLSVEDFLFHRCIFTPTFYQNPIVIFHSSGHRIPPLTGKDKKTIKDFVRKHGFGSQIKFLSGLAPKL